MARKAYTYPFIQCFLVNIIDISLIFVYLFSFFVSERVVIQCYGHLVADDGEGERPVIPDPIHKECFKSDAFAALFIEVNQTVMMCVNFMLQRICQVSPGLILNRDYL